MEKYLLGLTLLIAACLFSVPSFGQATAPKVVTTCGAMSPYGSQKAGTNGSLTVDPNGNSCGSGGGGGGGAVTIADGADVTQGAKADSACGTDAGTCTLIALIKRLNTIADSTGNVIPTAGTASGASNYHVYPGASDNHANIKNGAGTVYGVQVSNNSATVNYIRLYDAASGFNGCGSATNLKWGGIIPASTSGAGSNVSLSVGVNFTTGVSICVTSGYGGTDTTNATNTALEVNVNYN